MLLEILSYIGAFIIGFILAKLTSRKKGNIERLMFPKAVNPSLNYKEDISYLNELISSRTKVLELKLNLSIIRKSAKYDFPFNATKNRIVEEIYLALSPFYKSNLMKYMKDEEIISYIHNEVYIALTLIYNKHKLGSPIIWEDITDKNKDIPKEIKNKLTTTIIQSEDLPSERENVVVNKIVD